MSAHDHVLAASLLEAFDGGIRGRLNPGRGQHLFIHWGADGITKIEVSAPTHAHTKVAMPSSPSPSPGLSRMPAPAAPTGCVSLSPRGPAGAETRRCTSCGLSGHP